MSDELPTKRTKANPGQTYPGVICANCGAGMALGGNVAGLPQTFSATCPSCQKKGTYRKVDIQTLEAHSLH